MSIVNRCLFWFAISTATVSLVPAAETLPLKEPRLTEEQGKA